MLAEHVGESSGRVSAHIVVFRGTGSLVSEERRQRRSVPSVPERAAQRVLPHAVARWSREPRRARGRESVPDRTRASRGRSHPDPLRQFIVRNLTWSAIPATCSKVSMSCCCHARSAIRTSDRRNGSRMRWVSARSRFIVRCTASPTPASYRGAARPPLIMTRRVRIPHPVRHGRTSKLVDDARSAHVAPCAVTRHRAAAIRAERGRSALAAGALRKDERTVACDTRPAGPCHTGLGEAKIVTSSGG